MGKQFIISVGREFGAGGDEVAKIVAEKLGVKLYDKNLIELVAQEKNVDAKNLEKYDEKPRNVILSRKVGEHYNSNEDIAAQAQFEYLRARADKGESFVIVGRCGDYIFRGRENFLSIFITGREADKVSYVVKQFNVSERAAKEMLQKKDKRRRAYHNNHADTKWGDSRYYDICLNVFKAGIEESADLLVTYINAMLDL